MRAFIALVLLAGCTPSPIAIAKIEPRSGSSVVGSAVFIEEGQGVTMNLAIEGATPGEHGLHLHEKGDCASADGMSAGPHWNPGAAMHGAPAAAAHHSGDLGNLVVGADGRATLSHTTTEWTLAAGSSTATVFLNRAIIVHGKPDDFTQPAGNAGARVGCGVIVAAE